MSSHRQIIRSTAIVGAASMITILLGIARLKAAALIVGPVGIGLIGLYLNFVTAAATLIGLGLNASAVREIAAANGSGDASLLDSSRRALVWISGAAATITAAGLVLFREPVARMFLDAGLASFVPWLALAAVLLAFSTVCLVLLNGFRQIAALSWMQVGGALLGTIAGLAILIIWRERGILAYVVAVQASALVAGLALAARLPRPTTPPRRAPVLRQGRTMVALGLSFMTSVFALSVAVLAVRSTINDQLGGVALGQFAAGWVISSTYVSFVLQAMGTDFYPRLSEVADDRQTSLRLISEQVETAVLLATPVLLLTMAFAPWVLQLAYAEAFKGAAALLRWQILGDFFKIMAWPVAMSLLAGRRSKSYLAIEVSAAAFFALFVVLGTKRFGLEAAGIGYLVMYVAYLLVLFVLSGVRLNRHATKASLICGLLVLIAFAGTMTSEPIGIALGVIGSAATSIWLFHRLRRVYALPWILQRGFRRSRSAESASKERNSA